MAQAAQDCTVQLLGQAGDPTTSAAAIAEVTGQAGAHKAAACAGSLALPQTEALYFLLLKSLGEGSSKPHLWFLPQLQ